MKRENLDIAEKLGLRDCKESLDKAHQLATTRKPTREKVANNDIDRPTQRGLWQARRDRRCSEVLGEAIGIMRSVFIVIGRFASTYQTPPAHVLWRVELRILVLIHGMLALRWQENEDPLGEEEVPVVHS
ncbi:hypothetical protein N7527_003965 [Penicillium freii]|nr:hypothetical protein N7527_003965 [Penicillium freii]